MPFFLETVPRAGRCAALAAALCLGAGSAAGDGSPVALICPAGAEVAGGGTRLAALCDAVAEAVRERGHALRRTTDPGAFELALRVERAQADLMAVRLDWRSGAGAWHTGRTVIAGSSDAPLGAQEMRALARDLVAARPGPPWAE